MSALVAFCVGAFVGGVAAVSSTAAFVWFKKQRDSALSKVEPPK